jgi:hypothetical protein
MKTDQHKNEVLAGAGTNWVCGNYAMRDVRPDERDEEPPELARLPLCDCGRGQPCKIGEAGMGYRDYAKHVLKVLTAIKEEEGDQINGLPGPTRRSETADFESPTNWRIT